MKATALLSLAVAVAASLACFGRSQETSADFYVFNDASATSTFGNGFEASRALQPGTGYWSSAGDHATDEQVAWSGTLEVPGKLKGVRIRWEYAPQEVQISTSADGQNFFVAVPWRPTAGTGASFDEVISFSAPQECRVVVVTMRKAVNQFFGINQITPIGAGQPLFLIVAGVTSPSGEMCLEVEGGKMNKEGSRVVLSPCEDAIALGDGRELWLTNPQGQIVSARSHPPQCLVLQGGDPTDGGTVSLSKCSRALEEGDGRSSWAFQANSQLRLAKGGSWCMTQKNVNGSTAGLADLIAGSAATAEASSSADEAHGPQKAVDRDTNTSWASELFEESDEFPVTLDIDIGKVVRLAAARIEWEQPALAYSIQASVDGAAYIDVVHNEANPAVSTKDLLDGVAAQYVRIKMQRPHPRLGKYEEKFRYAIKEINIFAGKLEPAVGDCREAASSDDARDKYFIYYVSGFDEDFARKTATLGVDVIAKRKSLEELSGKLEELFTEMDDCREEKIQQRQRINALRATAGRLMASFQLVAGRAKAYSIMQLMPGDSAEHPAMDCYWAKSKIPEAVSGFYWVLPRCASKALRAYCDMESGTMIYVMTKQEIPRVQGRPAGLLASASDIRQACGSVGLQPFVPRAVSQIYSAMKAAKQMGLQLNNEEGIPIAFDQGCSYAACSGTFRDLYDGTTDLTGLVLALASADSSVTASSDTAGLGKASNERLSYFALATTPLAAVLCSTNATGEAEQAPALALSCEDVMEGHEAFKGTISTNILVECPPGCAEAAAATVFGSDGIYAESSAICKAGIHAGLIKSGGVFSVSIESPIYSFEGSKQNGVESKSLQLPPGDAIRSMRVFKIEEECPGEATEHSAASTPPQLPLTSFVELESRTTAAPTTASAAAPPAYDPALAVAFEAAKDRILATHGIDPVAVKDAKTDAGVTVGEVRKRVKPAEQLSESTYSEAVQLFRDVETLTYRLLAASAGAATRLEYLQEELKHLEEKHIALQGFQSYQLKPQDTSFEKEFVVEDSSFTRGGPSHWGFALLVAEHPNVFGQSSSIKGVSEVHGTYAFLRRRNLYDFVLHVEFLPMGSGGVGIGFRMKDRDNGYLLLMHQKAGKKKLLRLDKGIPKIVAERKDGGFVQGIWHKVRIQATGGHIKVCVGDEDAEPAEIFSALDERFVSGTVAFFSSAMQDGVYFDKLNVEAQPCQTPQVSPPPLPPLCSVFVESYFSSVSALYAIVDGADKGGSVGHWEYRDGVRGRNKVLVQLNAVRGPADIGTIAVLKGQRTCRNGRLSVDFFPQCTKGTIGAVFRFSSEANYMAVEATATELRLRVVVDKKAAVLARSPLKLQLNGWHSLQVAFDGPRVVARVETPAGETVKLLGEASAQQGFPSDGAIGLSAYNCGGVAFDEFELSPFVEPESEADSRFAGVTSRVAATEKAWSPCVENVHILARREHCAEMLRNKERERQILCPMEYCHECCSFQTSLLSPNHKTRCEKSCMRNNEEAHNTEALLQAAVVRCAKGGDKRSALCSQDDDECLFQACNLCCEGAAAGDGAWSRQEVSECQSHCRPPSPSSVSLKSESEL